MFGFKWPAKRLSDEETRVLLVTLVSTGCLLIAKSEGRINQSQNYFLLSSLYHWLNMEDGNEEHNKKAGYRLTDQLAKISSYAEDPSIMQLFSKGKQLHKNHRLQVIQACMIFALMGSANPEVMKSYNPEEAMILIGHLSRDIGLSADITKSLLPEAVEVADTYSLIGTYSEGYEESFRLLQQALKRATNSS